MYCFEDEMIIQIAKFEAAMMTGKDPENITRDDLVLCVGVIENGDRDKYKIIYLRLGLEGFTKFLNMKYAIELL
jgi:hypothetical protein